MSRSLASSRSKARARARETNQALSWIVAALAFTVAALALVAVFAEYLRGARITWLLLVPGLVFLAIGIIAAARAGRGRRARRA